jgi:beta-glucosidase
MEYRHSGNAAAGNIQLSWIPPSEPLLAEAVAVAKNADVTVAFVGLNPALEGEEMTVNVPGFRGGDRTDLNLPAGQQRLLEAVLATGKPVVVVLTSGSAVAITTAAEKAAAVMAAWYGGEEIGTAIAETLAGQNNPAGRLPVTVLQRRRAASALRKLFDEQSHVPILQGGCPLSLRVRLELFHL